MLGKDKETKQDSPNNEPIAAPAKMSKEVAEAELARFADCFELNLFPEDMDDDDRKDIDDVKRTFVSALIRGRITLSEDGTPTVHPTMGGDSLVFCEMKGSDLMAADGVKEGKNIHRLVRMMASITKTSASTFARMPERDLVVCRAVMTLFMAR